MVADPLWPEVGLGGGVTVMRNAADAERPEESTTTTRTVAIPLAPVLGVITIVREVPVPDKVMPETGTTAGLEVRAETLSAGAGVWSSWTENVIGPRVVPAMTVWAGISEMVGGRFENFPGCPAFRPAWPRIQSVDNHH